MQTSDAMRRENAKLYPPSLRAKRSNPCLRKLRNGLLRCARNDVDRPRRNGSPSRRMGRAKRNPSPHAPALMGIASLHPSYGTGVSRRRLLDVVFAGEQMNQRALDLGLPGRRVDLCAQEVGDGEHVAEA